MKSLAFENQFASFPQALNGFARIALVSAAAMISGCSATPSAEPASSLTPSVLSATPTRNALDRDNSRYLPVIGGSAEAIDAVSTAKLENLRLISVNLVSALVQLPDVNPNVVTLQVTSPTTAFGNLVIRALEDAGYGLQRVPSDQGLHYVQYSQRFAETDAGPVSDYVLRVGDFSLQREYRESKNGVYPSSLLQINGVDSPDTIVLNDALFQEQGGDGEIFVSGVTSGRKVGDVLEIEANRYDRTPEEQRADRSTQLLLASRSVIARVATDAELRRYERLRRTVLIFDNPETRIMGAGNKQAVRLLVREFQPGDLYQVVACTDVDGQNEDSILRGVRVVEEFLSYDVPIDNVVKAACRRTTYRQNTDDAPVAVEVVHLRRR